MRTLSVLLLAMVAAFPTVRTAQAQAVATASGPGGNISVGGEFSAYNTAYGQNKIAGGCVFVDTNPQWRVGFEGEARFLRWHAQQQVTEGDYLGGLRVALWSRPARFSPYAKFLAGAGEITLPFHYAHGGFLTYASGAGLDVALSDRVTMRAIDFEYQRWPQFTYGALSPYGFSAGVSLRLNSMSRYPKGPRFRP